MAVRCGGLELAPSSGLPYPPPQSLTFRYLRAVGESQVDTAAATGGSCASTRYSCLPQFTFVGFLSG